MGMSKRGTPQAPRDPAFRPIAQRLVNAEKAFVDRACDIGDLTPTQARAALAELQRHRLVKLDPIMGEPRAKHGDVWTRDVLRRAAGLCEAGLPPAGAQCEAPGTIRDLGSAGYVVLCDACMRRFEDGTIDDWADTPSAT